MSFFWRSVKNTESGALPKYYKSAYFSGGPDFRCDAAPFSRKILVCNQNPAHRGVAWRSPDLKPMSERACADFENIVILSLAEHRMTLPAAGMTVCEAGRFFFKVKNPAYCGLCQIALDLNKHYWLVKTWFQASIWFPAHICRFSVESDARMTLLGGDLGRGVRTSALRLKHCFLHLAQPLEPALCTGQNWWLCV